jgi:hypothetical protein
VYIFMKNDRLSGASWGWPSQASYKRPRSTPIATLLFPPVFVFQ